MKIIIHKSGARGLTSVGWLVSRHSFSFNEWYDPARVQFGALRVLNDDLILPGEGFPAHSHRDMEIVTIPLRGTVAHKDSSGGEGVTKSGDVQIMSAGTGVTHSEYNASSAEPLELLQIWVMPERQGLLPRYEQKTFDVSERQNKWQLLVSPIAEQGSLKVFQNAWFSIAHLVPGANLRYDFHGSAMGAYVFIVSGSVEIADNILTARDAMGITEASNVSIEAQGAADILVIEVPV